MEELKKIIFTVTNDLSYDQRMARICNSLDNAGFNIELVGRKRKTSVPLKPVSYKQTRLYCFFEKGLPFYMEYNIRLFFYLLFRPVDVLSAVDLDTMLPCTAVARIRSRKLVFDAHEYFTEVPEVTDRKFVKAVWKMIGALCVQHTHGTYTVSESLAEIFSDEYKKNFEVILNAPRLSQRVPYTAPIQKIILYQGDLNEGRGLPQIIEAMQRLDARLHIAGNGPLKQNLEELVLSLEVADKVTFFGYLPQEQLAEVTSQATIGINLLEPKGLSYYYSLSNKFFNYMHAGVPQICAPFTEYEKINRKFHIAVLCPCVVEEIVTSVQSLLKGDDLYRKMRSECMAATRVFNWENEEQKVVSLYNRVSK